MSKVAMRRLDEVGTISRGKSKHRPRNDPKLYGGQYPFVQTADIKNAGLYLYDYEQTYNEDGLAQSKLWEPGTLCITIAANIADTSILGIHACFPDSVMGFIPDASKCDVRYMKYSFDMLQRQMKQISQGATQDNLSWQKLATIRFPIPDLEQQRRIADAIAAYDNLIEKNRRQIALLEEAADLTYANWLNACDSSSFGTGTMSDFFDVTIGKTPPRAQTECFVAEGVPWASVKDLGNTAGPFISSTSECLTDEAIGNYKVKVKPAGTILLSFKLTIGRVAIAKQPTATNEAIAHFATDNDAMRLYTYEYLRSFDYDTLGSTSSIGKAINSKIVKAIPFSLPRESDLNQLYAQLNPLFCSMRLCQQRVTLLAEARDRLLPKLMSDEIEVSE